MTDTVDHRPIAVVRTRLPYIDRRSLSQAWFSALHLASDVPGHAIPARRANDAAFQPRSARAPLSVAPQRAAAVSLRATRLTEPRGAASAGGSTPPRDAAAATKARAAFEKARSYPPFRTSLTVGVEGARIKLLLRRDGPTLHVIALCAAANVDLVRRALACADAHLRRNGESVRACVRVQAKTSA